MKGFSSRSVTTAARQSCPRATLVTDDHGNDDVRQETSLQNMRETYRCRSTSNAAKVLRCFSCHPRHKKINTPNAADIPASTEAAPTLVSAKLPQAILFTMGLGGRGIFRSRIAKSVRWVHAHITLVAVMLRTVHPSWSKSFFMKL